MNKFWMAVHAFSGGISTLMAVLFVLVGSFGWFVAWAGLAAVNCGLCYWYATQLEESK